MFTTPLHGLQLLNNPLQGAKNFVDNINDNHVVQQPISHIQTVILLP